jgi:hypothetical protein
MMAIRAMAERWSAVRKGLFLVMRLRTLPGFREFDVTPRSFQRRASSLENRTFANLEWP